MIDTNPMVCVPRDLLEEALDAAAAVGMQDVADELDRILTPSTAPYKFSSAVLWRHREKKPGRVWNFTEYREVAEKAIRLGYEVQGFADIREFERLAEANLHHRNLEIEADDLIKSLRAQLSEIQQAARAVFSARDADEFPYGHPGHQHAERGRWDSTGAKCRDCATYDRLEELANQPDLHRQATALQDVAVERARQIQVEDRHPDHDDAYTSCELAVAAAMYALYSDSFPVEGYPPKLWPWDAKWWKPKNYRTDLVRAGALILAEIERLDRQQIRAAHSAASTEDTEQGEPS